MKLLGVRWVDSRDAFRGVVCSFVFILFVGIRTFGCGIFVLIRGFRVLTCLLTWRRSGLFGLWCGSSGRGLGLGLGLFLGGLLIFVFVVGYLFY